MNMFRLVSSSISIGRTWAHWKRLFECTGESAQRCARHADSVLRVMLGDICPLVNPWHQPLYRICVCSLSGSSVLYIFEVAI
jgi:hypothetical protein